MTELIDAAVAVLYRRVDGGVELFWARRNAQASFAPGFRAFPGGRVDASDARVPVQGAVGEQALVRATAARELFEEAGILVAQGAERLGETELSALRRAVLAEPACFAARLRQDGLQLRAGDFVEAGRWATPAFMPRRFDTRFFLVEAPPGALAQAHAAELSEGAWVRPEAALDVWRVGEVLLHPPQLAILKAMANFTSVAQSIGRVIRPAQAEGFVPARIEFQQGIRLVPLRTPTLPPATHTSCYVLGNGELLIVDPGAAELDELGHLFGLIDGLVAEGCAPKAVVLTHQHGDHVGGARAVMERLSLPLWCHARTAERLELPAQRLLSDGDGLELAGAPPMRWSVLHTPGHAPGHLCLIEERSRAVVAGDMVAGIGTIVIDPPEGDMGDYLASLERLRAWPAGVIYPAHGPIIADGPKKLAAYVAHRREREQLVLAALTVHGVPLHDIVRAAYADVASELHPLAERSVLAILAKLEGEGRVRQASESLFQRVSG